MARLTIACKFFKEYINAMILQDLRNYCIVSQPVFRSYPVTHVSHGGKILVKLVETRHNSD